jgi:hypothetical protein
MASLIGSMIVFIADINLALSALSLEMEPSSNRDAAG